jgi:hypothetical protein
MIVKTTPEQDSKIRYWYRDHVRAHHAEGCEPPGYTLMVELGLLSHFDVTASVKFGAEVLELGEVVVERE